MHKAIKYRLLPTEEQIAWLNGLFSATRFVYNLALETKATAWNSAKKSLSSFDLMKQLVDLKNECPWLKNYPAQSLQSAITNMDAAFIAFFRGNGFPRYKSRFGKQSATFKQYTAVVGNKIKLTKIGLIDFVKHREMLDGDIKKAVVSKEPSGSFFISLVINDKKNAPPKQSVDAIGAIGIDLGLKTFATLSNGVVIENPKFLHKQLRRLRVEQRKLSRKLKKSENKQSKGYQKQKIVVAKLHEKIANKRKDFLQKASTNIIRQFDTICVENLNVAGMRQNENLAKAISDVSWSEFLRMLTYKSEWYGKNLIRIDRFAPSSKMCSECGSIFKELTLAYRTWICENCGAYHDRDLNAAINIKKLGLQAKPSTANVAQKSGRIGCEQDAAENLNHLISKTKTMTKPTLTIEEGNTNDIVYIPSQISEKPKTDGRYMVRASDILHGGHIVIDDVEFSGGYWLMNFDHWKFERWLRPVKLSDLLKEAREQAWDAAINWHNGNDREQTPNRSAYLNSFTQQIKQ